MAVGVKISVIIPSFNQGGFLSEAIESAVSQGWGEVELLVVDGGSADETLEVIAAHGRNLTWWVSESDRGQGDAINKGLARATGDLVAFIGADDVFLPGAFEDAARRFERNPGCGAVVGGFVRIDENSRVISDPVPARYPWQGPTDLMIAEPGSWRLHQVSTFFSKQALVQVGCFVDGSLRYVLDRELLNRVCRCYPVVTSGKVYAAFRHHPASKSTAEILPFSRELAALHLRDAPGDEPARLKRRRRALSRRQLAGGYLKLARATAPGPASARALAAVPFVSARAALTRTYVVRWLDALGIAKPVRRLLRRPQTSPYRNRPLSEVSHEL